MRVLVTGGAGFIGSHIVDHLLSKGHEPFVVDNLITGRRENLPDQVPLYEVDICDDGALASVFDEVKPEIVCQQAAQMSVSLSVRRPAFDAEVNVLGLLRVLEHSVRVDADRIVFASSGGVLYGDVLSRKEKRCATLRVRTWSVQRSARASRIFYSARSVACCRM